MNIELAKIAIDKMAFFIPEDVLSDLYKDHDATAEILAQDESRTVFSIVYHDKKDKRILSVTVKHNEINVHYNGTMQVFSHRIDESFYNDVLNVLFDVQAIQPVESNQAEEKTMNNLKDMNAKLAALKADFDSQHVTLRVVGGMSITEFSKLTLSLVESIVALEKAIKLLSSASYTFNIDGSISEVVLSHFVGGTWAEERQHVLVTHDSLKGAISHMRYSGLNKQLLLAITK